VQAIAELLEAYPTIPAVARELDLIAEVQTDEWWVDVTLPLLEDLRRRLRLLVPFIERAKREPMYADFEDQIGEAVTIDIGGLPSAGSFERFRRKARAFLTEHTTNVAVQKIHHNRPITASDIVELQRILVENGVGDASDMERAIEEAGSFGIFIRRLVGLDRSAAKDALAGFLDEHRYSAAQIEFVSLIIDELTQNGIVEARRFYESPFTDVSAHGPDGLFGPDDVARLVAAVDGVRHNAEAA
jgi:type I restriction enzyme R subunit